MNSGQILFEAFAERLIQSSAIVENLLETLVLAADECLSAMPRKNKKLIRLIEFLECESARQSLLTTHFTFSKDDHRYHLANQLMFCPRGIPEKERVGFVSSRLGNSLDEHPQWFDSVRSICSHMNSDSQALVCTRKTAGFDVYCRSAFLFGLDRIETNFNISNRPTGDWLLELPSMSDEANQRNSVEQQIFPVIVSRHIDQLSEVDFIQHEGSTAIPQIDDRDSFHTFFSEIIYAIKVADNGNTARSIEGRLTWEKIPGVVFISSSNDAVSTGTRDRLMDQGAIQHHFVRSTEDRSIEQTQFTRNTPTTYFEHPVKILSMDQVLPRIEGWLTHCTRRRTGPWPDEDLTTFLDDLLFRRVGSNHSALAALCRIIRTGRLVATHDMIRGETPVVSFSSQPLNALLKMRTFRSHLSRWDYEPYGLCISMESMQAQGVRPVIYAGDDEFDSLDEFDRPFFQPTASDANTEGGEKLDWSSELEWRTRGDVQLSEIQREHCIVFVPTIDEADFVRSLSPFDICVTDEIQPSRNSVL